MNRNVLPSRTVACCLLFLTVSLLLHGPAWGARLKTVTFAGTNTVWVRQFQLFTESVQRESKRETRFQFVGGPEAIPPFEQIEAVRRGVVDVALLPAAYFVAQLPEADAMKLSPYSPMEERKKGIFGFYRDLMERRLNVIYLGKIAGGIKYHFYLRKPLKGPDLKGLKIRVTPIYEPFVRALGGVGVTTAPGEVYVALERAIVDGFGWPSIGVRDMGWEEVVRYVIDPGFYQTDVCVLINRNTWEGLPAGEKKLISGAIERAERETYDLSRKLAREERQFLLSRGIRVIELKDGERKFYLDTAYRAGWERVIAKSPETGGRLRKLMEE